MFLLRPQHEGSDSGSMFDDNGNKCGKCQNHEFEVLKKGHARECPFKRCNCLKCRLLDARSDILQVISGKETKLKGTKKDPNCGFCQNHGVKILRKGHVRSCGFGQERHFRLDNCFDCEVHYIRNEVNRLQIKMRRAMKEDKSLSEEQRKVAREAITRDEVEKVCDMARVARKKREQLLVTQQASCSSSAANSSQLSTASSSSTSASHTNPAPHKARASPLGQTSNSHALHFKQHKLERQCASSSAPSSSSKLHDELSALAAEQMATGRHLAGSQAVWRPWSEHQADQSQLNTFFAQQFTLQQQQQHQQQQQANLSEHLTLANNVQTHQLQLQHQHPDQQHFQHQQQQPVNQRHQQDQQQQLQLQQQHQQYNNQQQQLDLANAISDEQRNLQEQISGFFGILLAQTIAQQMNDQSAHDGSL